MAKEKPRGVGILGSGTVGAEVARQLLQQSAFSIRKVAVRDLARKRPVSRKILTTRWQEVVDDPAVDVVLELMGGEQPAYAAMKRAIGLGKAVITANKLVLSRHGRELYGMARRKRTYLGFRSTIAGIHPMIFFLHYSIPSGKSIRSIHAVLNGTCNFILDEMSSAGLDFKQAVKRAQEKGFAEANPTLDVEGVDTFHKISIIHQLIFGVSKDDARIAPRKLLVEGITKVSAQDLVFASELGYRIKLLGTIETVDGSRSIRVHPALVPKEHPLALLKGAENGMVLVDEYGERTSYTGLGAGAMPTRIAVLQDLHEWSQGQPGVLPRVSSSLALLPEGEWVGKYFFNFSVIDRPGVLAQISRVLWKNHISISAVVQKERREGDLVPLIITTHDTRECDVRRAFGTILKLAVVKSPSTFIRIVV